MVRASRRAASVCLLFSLGLAACANATGAVDEDTTEDDLAGSSVQPGRGEAAVTVSYAPTAEGNFVEGEKAYQNEEFLAAQRYFGYIRSKFPYSRFSVLAELRIADCQFERKRYLEAIDSYNNFVRLHPTHDKAAYARFRIGKSYFNQIPSNFFLLPPAHEKDQAAVRDAEKALLAYVRQNPKGEDVPEAEKILAKVRGRLMAHERYVADFYKNLERDRAYVGRLEVIRTSFADVGLDAELLLEISEVWARLGEPDKARAALTELMEKFPKADEREDAEELLRTLPAAPAPEAPKEAPAQTEPPSDTPPDASK